MVALAQRGERLLMAGKIADIDEYLQNRQDNIPLTTVLLTLRSNEVRSRPTACRGGRWVRGLFL
jgi:hypothetical protein